MLSHAEQKIINYLRSQNSGRHSGLVALDTDISCRGMADLVLSSLLHKELVDVEKTKKGVEFYKPSKLVGNQT